MRLPTTPTWLPRRALLDTLLVPILLHPLSATAGVICGCLLGMTSLLLMDLEKGERCDGTRLGPLGPHACSPHPAPPTEA